MSARDGGEGNFRLFQGLANWVADTSQISLKELKDTHHKLLDILHSSSPSRIALPINQALLDPAKLVWQTLALVLPTCKQRRVWIFSFPIPSVIQLLWTQ